MTLHECRLVPLLVLSAIAPLEAQTLSRFEAGAGSGGSAFGWQPRVGLNGEMPATSLGPIRALLRGALDRVAAPASSPYELFGGARLATPAGPTGWWLGATVMKRNGFKDAIEQPRIETGGWRRIGNVVVTVSAARRKAALSGMGYSYRTVTNTNVYLDTLTGKWDSVRVVTHVTDSSRRSDVQRWAETQAAVAWEGRRLSAELTLGGRLASRGVPQGAWASADLAVRLSAPLSLVVGAGGSTAARFALDAEHRYVTLGFRISPHLTSTIDAGRAPGTMEAVSAFAVAAVGDGVYRLALRAPGARRVEISGDFTGWKPTSLERGNDGQWTLTLPLAVGAHRMNARIDGGHWMVPPGLTTMNDDFSGEVGLLVIERPPRGRIARSDARAGHEGRRG